MDSITNTLPVSWMRGLLEVSPRSAVRLTDPAPTSNHPQAPAGTRPPAPQAQAAPGGGGLGPSPGGSWSFLLQPFLTYS